MEYTEKPGNHSQPECLETADETARLQRGFHHHQLRHRISREEHEEVDRANNEVVVETTFMVTKLTTNVEYRFRVTAVKSVGPGASSESVAFKARVASSSSFRRRLSGGTRTTTNSSLNHLRKKSDRPVWYWPTLAKNLDDAHRSCRTLERDVLHFQNHQLGYGPAYSPEDVIVAVKLMTPPSHRPICELRK